MYTFNFFMLNTIIILKITLNSLSLLLHRPRSRGKTTVEDEDSMDGLETTETENIVEAGIKLHRFLKNAHHNLHN